MAAFPGFFRFLRALLFEDWLLKFICLGLAVLMWFYIDGELTDVREFTVPLQSSDLALPEGWEVAPRKPLPKFSVRLRGPRRKLPLLSAESIDIKRVPIETPRPGLNTINIRPQDMDVEGFDVLSVAPKDDTESRVDLIMVVRSHRPVRADVKGEPAPGFSVARTTVEPREVFIEGAADQIERIQYVVTEPVEITDVRDSVVREVGVVQSVLDLTGQRISFRTTDRVTVRVEIRPTNAQNRQTLEIRTMTPPGLAMTVEPRVVEVVTAAADGTAERPELLSQIVAFVEWPGTWERPASAQDIKGPIVVPVKFHVPPGLRVRAVDGEGTPRVSVRGGLAGSL